MSSSTELKTDGYFAPRRSNLTMVTLVMASRQGESMNLGGP